MATVLLAPAVFGRPMVATPGVPPDIVKILRDAYNRSLKDPALLEELKKRRWVAGCDQRRGVGEAGERSGYAAAGCHRADDEAVGKLARLGANAGSGVYNLGGELGSSLNIELFSVGPRDTNKIASKRRSPKSQFSRRHLIGNQIRFPPIGCRRSRLT